MIQKENLIYKWIRDILDLLYPNTCLVCGRVLITGEEYLCLHCLNDIPRTHYHLYKENHFEELFRIKATIEQTATYFYFTHDSAWRGVIHHIKYKGGKECGSYLGALFASELKKTNWFEGIDVIVPVPLHRSRQRQRGYNQSEWIARGVAIKTDLPIENTRLQRVTANTTQTNKSIFDRWKNSQELFSLTDRSYFKEKHILLIDDITTTGATLLACAKEFEGIEGCRVSLLTLALATLD